MNIRLIVFLIVKVSCLRSLDLLNNMAQKDAVRILTIRKNKVEYMNELLSLGLEWLENVSVVLPPSENNSLLKYEFIKRNHKRVEKDFIKR